MFNINPLFRTDSYKLDHRRQYPHGTEYVQANWTARGSRIPGIDNVVFFGLRPYVEGVLVDSWNKYFFNKKKKKVLEKYKNRIDRFCPVSEITLDHISDLWDLGYLPIRIDAVEEGTLVPLRVPMFTVTNTDPRFFWLVNYIETDISANIWQPITSATLAYNMRKLLNHYANMSGNEGFVPWQGHDFSLRGMAGIGAGALSGAAHLTSFYGTDVIPAIDVIEKYYNGDASVVAGSVFASEHAVACAGGRENEEETLLRHLDLYPSGIYSFISDTWDLWSFITKTLYKPNVKEKIMSRDGKLVIRPDSSKANQGPEDILCGDDRMDTIEEKKGVVELLWDIFGGTTNIKGYKELDPHIGCIYGDGITMERAKNICERLMAKGFASTIPVLGVGSFTYQHQTRDTFGQALKSTFCVINGEDKAIYKDPKTDDGLKKSAVGHVGISYSGEANGLVLVDDNFLGDRTNLVSATNTVFEDGYAFYSPYHDSFNAIRSRIMQSL